MKKHKSISGKSKSEKGESHSASKASNKLSKEQSVEYLLLERRMLQTQSTLRLDGNQPKSKKLIEGGELIPASNTEVDWSSYEKNEIKNEVSLFKILKIFLWNKTDQDKETYPMFKLNVLNKKGENFPENYINKGGLIPDPTEEKPFQLIYEHLLEDAFYSFSYTNNKKPISIEYKTYDDQQFLVGVTQEDINCEYEFQSDGGTQDFCVTFRFVNKKGEIKCLKSSKSAQLPLEITDDSDKECINNLKKVAKYFFSELK